MATFGRRSYTVRDDKASIEDLRGKVRIFIGDKEHTAVQLRAPGMIAIVARPDAPNEFTIEIVEAGGRRYTDHILPAEAGDPLPWQKEALGLK